MKYPKVLQILALASAITIAAPCVVIPSHASETITVLTPQEYEEQYNYVLPSGYHYVLSEEKYVILDENDNPRIEADVPAEPETPAEPEAPAESEPAAAPAESAEAQTSVDPENPSDPSEGSDAGLGGDGTNTDDGSGENMDGDNGDEGGNAGDSDIIGDQNDGDISGDQNETENPDESNGEDQGAAEQPEVPETPVAPGAPAPGEVQASVAKALEQKENAVEAEDPFFLTSAQFKAVHDRIQYNVAVPIEGLPSFITQEMVVGALKAQDETGYPASVTIAQIIQESGYGKYGPGGEEGKGLSYLAFQYCNLFGIKGTGTAGIVSMKTSEMNADGSTYSTYAGFRVYNTYTECIEDRSKILDEVYSDLTKDVTDANTFAMKIGKRWATSINYGRHLINTMRRYDLYRLDDMTLNEFSDMIGEFANPCPGSNITSLYGPRTAPIAGATTYHRGLDLGTGEYNIPTYAAKAGTVVFAGEAGPCGNLITIDHGDGMVTKYMHHAEIYVEEGDTVEKGQQIGLSGTTGNSTGNHLHFQVEVDGKAVDPLKYLHYEEDEEKMIKMRDLMPLEIEMQKQKQRMLTAEGYGAKLPGWYQIGSRF